MLAAQVRLREVPPGVLLDLLEHLDMLLRELRLLAVELGEGRMPHLPIAVAHGIEELLGALTATLSAAGTLAVEAQDRHDEAMEIEFEMADGMAAMTAELAELLEQADEWARQGTLLTEPASQDVVLLRRWIAQELTQQEAGADPVPFARPGS